MVRTSSSQFTVWGVRLAGATAAGIGGFWLTAWLTGAAAAWSATGTAIVMKTNLAFCLTLGAGALLWQGGGKPGLIARRIVDGVAVVIGAVGAFTVSEHLFGYDLGIDQLLAVERAGALGTVSPNRMGMPASLSLMLFAAGLIASKRRGHFTVLCGVAICVINFVPLVGYLYKIAGFYSPSTVMTIALPSVLALISLGAGLVLAVSEAGPVELLGRADVGGLLFRQWLPVVLLAPLAIGFLSMQGQKMGWYDLEARNGFVVLATISLFTVFLSLGALRLSRSAQAHAAADAELRSVALFPQEDPDPVLRVAADGTLLFANRAAARLLAAWRCELGGRLPEAAREAVAQALQSGARREWETQLGESSFGFVLTPLAERGYVNFYGRDITLRKRTEELVEEARRSVELERNRLQAVMNGAGNSHLVYLDRDFNFVCVNDVYARSCGYRPEEMTGRNHFVMYPDAENERIFRRVRDTGEPVSLHDKPFQFPDQPERGVTYWDWTLNPVKDGRGEIEGLILSLFETTERKRIEAALRESEERFRTMADGTPIPIWVVDERGRNRFVNRAYVEFFGVTLEAAQEENWQPQLHPEDRRQYLAAVAGALREHKEFRVEARVRRYDGAWRWIESHGRPRWSSAGGFLGLTGSSPDITGQKEFQAELERLVAERTTKLQEMVGELEHYSYTITHDMRAPLRAMRGFAEIMAEDSPACADEPARGYLQRIRTAAARMDALITDALNYNLTVRRELNLAPVDAAALLRGMLDSYPELQSAKAQIEIVGAIPPVVANAAGLTQCFSNLLSNAVKFAKPEQKPRIRVWAETITDSRTEAPAGPGAAWVRLWVEDNGIGIPASMQARVFDLFSRGHKKYEGTGIGLALVRKVVTRMGGRVGVDSVEGEGSRFWLDLRPALGGSGTDTPA